MNATADQLPQGFLIRIRADVRRMSEGQVLLGGSPLRAVRLAPEARALIENDQLRVTDLRSARLARRLLAANLADPELPTASTEATSLTVIIPVRDRHEQLDRALETLHPLTTIVVDDGSTDPTAIARIARRHGARLITLPKNIGPAGARNAGLAAATTPYIAFVDSDIEVAAHDLLLLARHFSDPGVAMIGPRIVSFAHRARPRWHERYDESASSLDLGSRACTVHPGSTVGWLPSACILARATVLGDGFAEDLRIGEDVDLVWRLLDAGHTVRYDPTVLAKHETRATVRAWLERKFAYGTGGAKLARRHGNKTAVAQLSPAMAGAAAALLLRRSWSLPLAGLCLAHSARSVHASIPESIRTPKLSARITARGLGWALRQESALLLRHWWPATFIAVLLSRSARRILISALLIDLALAATEGAHRKPLISLLGRRADDLAYGSGLWWGATKARSAHALAIRIIHQPAKPTTTS